MKTPRFITEYANAKIKFLASCKQMDPQVFEDSKSTVERIVNLVGKGLITIDEAMRAISET